MLIEPNSTIKVYRNIPLDNSYENTIYFANITAQYTYFHVDTTGVGNKLKFSLPFQSYQRAGKGKLRIEKKADELYDCNYMAFLNASYGQKWFYAFITSVNYINDVTSEITYEIDVMQTYFFDVTIHPSLIEREHCDDDSIGLHTLDEGLETGDLMTTRVAEHNFSEQSVLAILNKNEDDIPIVGTSEYNIITALELKKICSVSDSTTFNAFLDDYRATPEWIVSLIQYPKQFNAGYPFSDGAPQMRWYGGLGVSWSEKMGNEYTPKNNKLYCYPYSSAILTNLSGQSLVLKRQYFEDKSACRVEMRGVLYPHTTILAYPKDYNGYKNDISSDIYNRGDFDNIVTLTDFPEITWSTDEFNTWLLRNSMALYNKNVADNFKSGIDSANNLMGLYNNKPSSDTQVLPRNFNQLSGESWGELSRDTEKFVSSLLSGGEYASKQYGGNSVSGSLSNNYVLNAYSCKKFEIRLQTVRPEYAVIIDQYFSRYGYKCLKVKTPNRNVRKHYTYTKTVNCFATGGCSSIILNKICDIYNNGITFWSNPSECGIYSDTIMNDNSIIE